MIRDMVEKNRVPKYAVRILYPSESIGSSSDFSPLYYSVHDVNDPVFSFVNEHYNMVDRIGPFEIWQINPNTSPIR